MTEEKCVLLVEDNEKLSEINSRALRLEGYTVLSALTLEEARRYLKENTPDIIVLDILMPDGNGVDFCREIRERTAAPILFLTSVGGHEQTLLGLAAGGDDYLVKPFDIDMLAAKVGAFLRRDEIARRLRPAKSVTRGALSLDPVSQHAYFSGKDMLLTPKDFALLMQFVVNANRVLTAAELYLAVWNQPILDDANAIKVAVSRLRRKLMGSGYTIASRRGEGYVFSPE